MSPPPQHDYVIDDQAGATFLTDLNSCLAADVSNNSGAAAPGTTFAYMMWADTTSGWLKQRNSTNTSWINIHRLSNGAAGRRPVSSRSSNTILADADFGTLIRATAAFTQTITAAATLGDGWWCSFRNDSASNCIIDPNSGELIDGNATLNVLPGASIIIECSSSAFYTVSGAVAVDTGSIKPWPVASVPSGWMECDGSAISRSTYSSLFALLGSTYGAGDGSTTFNIPDLRGRTVVGVGTGVDVEAASSIDDTNDAFNLVSNDNRWITGMAVTLTTTGTLPTGLLTGTTYRLVRRTPTQYSFASTLSAAQNGTWFTFSGAGSGTHSVNRALTTRTLATRGGEEVHAMSVTELLAHSHGINGAPNVGVNDNFIAHTANSNGSLPQTSTVGGNNPMNVMSPYVALKMIIKT